jgi:DNA-binding NarL/FixJ family response regulator
VSDVLTWIEERALNREEYEARMAFAAERRERVYQLHRQGLTAKEIARRIGGIAPYRVRVIIARASELDQSA